MQSVKLDVHVHRSGISTSGIEIGIRDRNGGSYSSGHVSTSGTITIGVPENERYTIVVKPFNKNNEIMMPPHSGRKSFSIDINEYKMG
jgi:hypothetical protein